MINIPQVFSGVSVIAGVLLLIAGSIFLNQMQNQQNFSCSSSINTLYGGIPCTANMAGMAAGSIAILVSVLQIATGVFALITGKQSPGRICHGVVFVFTIISLWLGIHFKEWYLAHDILVKTHVDKVLQGAGDFVVNTFSTAFQNFDKDEPLLSTDLFGSINVEKIVPTVLSLAEVSSTAEVSNYRADCFYAMTAIDAIFCLFAFVASFFLQENITNKK